MKIGELKFIIIHHATCEGGAFHYRIGVEGDINGERLENERGQHANCIGVVLEGQFDDGPPAARQIEALKRLLLELKSRHPFVEIGGHRQVRGDRTTCPGAKFGLNVLLTWARSALVEERDDALHSEIERQYRPGS